MSSGAPTDEHTLVAPVTDDGTPNERPEASAGTLVANRYEIVRRIGKGGMGEVMAARDEQVGRDVAIKRMRAASPSDRAIQRFLREASIQGRLEHPAIVPVHEIGRDSDGLPFFAMKKLTGTTLAQILHNDLRPFSLQRVLRAFAEVCLAVEFAHVRGIVHRDLKPENIMLGDFGEVYVLDWGVAKVTGEDDGQFSDIGTAGTGQHATAVGTAVGTPGYMAPEQARGRKDIDGRADVYTLGCLLFEILAGEPLHPPTTDPLSVLTERDARPSSRSPKRQIAPELDELCVHATMTDPEARLRTARELGDRVQRYLDGDRDLALRRSLAREHLERAHTAFSSGTAEDPRRAAMREAAAALALDPALAGAAELVGRLMLEPPSATPKEVDQAIAADDVRIVKENAKAGMIALAGAAAFTPFLWWIAPSASAYVAALSIMIVLNIGVCVHALLTSTPRPGLVVIGNAVLVVVIARMFSPILIAPGLAAVLAMAMVLTPRFSWLGTSAGVAGFMIGAVLLPWIFERIGVLSPTMAVDDSGVNFSAPAIAGAEDPTILVAVLYTIALIAGACIMGDTMRTRTRTAIRQLQIQAWQLRQLVPHH
jgi:serine/threonine-protein kinase